MLRPAMLVHARAMVSSEGEERGKRKWVGGFFVSFFLLVFV